MADFTSFSALRSACLDLPSGNPAASAAAARREAVLTKPPGSLGRLEELVGWLAQWQGRAPPQLQQVEILVFAGNHGVTGRGVSAYPAEVTAQMVANFAGGGAAINQLARTASARLRVIPLSLDRPTADFTQAPALSEQEFLAAVTEGYTAVSPACDLICLGEMGIGNTTAAAAIAAALFGGGGARWAGRGTGVDAEGLDGFVCTAAVAPLSKLRADTLAHALSSHVSAEAGHRMLLDELALRPLLDLDMRLGEASGAALAVLVLRAALACHTGMATFAEAGVSDRPAADDTTAAAAS